MTEDLDDAIVNREIVSNARSLSQDCSQFMWEVEDQVPATFYDTLLPDELENIATAVSEIDAAVSSLRDAKTRLLRLGYYGTPSDDKAIVTQDGTIVEFTSSTSKKAWKHDDLKQLVTEKVTDRLMNRDTGELASPEQVVAGVLEAAGIGYWKVGPLRQLGIEPKDFCESGSTSYSASITRPRKIIVKETS